MDSYQPIFDAVRSKMGYIDSSEVVRGISDRVNIDSYFERMCSEISSEMTRPSVLFRPKLTIDGNQWCALYGDDLQSGVAGFGDSPSSAMWDFDCNFSKKLQSHKA